MEYELEHSDTLDDVLDEFLSHSAKGTVWKDHKYIKKENGRYYYADDKKISKTSSDELMDEVDAIQQQMAFCDQKAKEYDELAKSNPDEAEEYKAQAKKYRDEIERLNGEREQIAKGLEKKDKHDEIVNDFRNEPILDTLNKYKKNIYLGNPKLKMKHSDTLDDVLDDYLMHYGVGPDDNPPGRGSGRYAKGSGKRPFQHDENKDVGEKKRNGLFSALGAIHKALNPGFSAVDKAAEEAGRQLKEKEEAAKKEKEQEEAKKTVEQTSEKLSELNDAKTIMSDMDDFFKKYRERPDHDVSKEREEIFDKIENNWLSTSSGSREMHERMRTDPEFKKRVISACDLGLKGLDEMNGPGYVDWDAYKERPGNQREWFAIEDQTIGMLPIADLINRGYTGEQVGKLIDFIDEEGGELRVKENRPGYGCYFDVTEGWADELKPFARACERAKNKEINHSNLLDDFLAHYGVGPDDNPPGRGSGRYAKGTGENPYQHDDVKRAQMKKRGLFGSIQTALAKRKANTEIDKYRDYVDGILNGSLKNNKALQDKYKELNERTDGKEFDRGPFRYQYNVPDELSGKETDREKLAAEWKKFSEEVVDKHAKAEALKKARETKAANKAKTEEEKKTKEAREAEKAKAIASGDPEQISKWLSEMTDEEQYNAINRIRQTQDIKNQAAAQVKAREDAARAEEQRIAQQKATEEARKRAIEEANRPKTKQEIRKEKFENFMDSSQQVLDRAKQIRDMAEKGIDIWNTIAALNNTFNEDHEMKMIKRPEQFFKEKADKEAAKIRREQQLEDAKTKRENDLADALRKEQREDEKWRKEFINKNGVDPDDITLKNKETSESKESESKSSEPKKEEKKSGLFDMFKKKDKSEVESEPEAPRQTRNEPEDWYDTPQTIARKLLTSTAESRKEAAEAGTNYWKSISEWANDPSTERESKDAYNRDRANENARYNEWEANEQKNAAQRIANEERERREAAERYENESASREARLKREAQQYKFAQTAYEEKIKARDLDREHNNGDNWRHHDEQVKEAREKLDEISKDYNLFRKYL